MKKAISLFLILLIFCLLVACNKNDDSYSVIVTGATQALMEPMETSYRAGERIEIKACPITDVSLHVFVNGEKISRSHNGSDYWGYEFVMPEENVTIYLTYDAFYGKEEYGFDELCHNIENLENEITKVSIKTVNHLEKYSFVQTQYSFNQEDIDNFKAIVNQRLIKVDDSIVSESTYGNDYSFYFNTEALFTLGFEEELFIWNDFSNWQGFKFKDESYTLPTIESPDLVTYSFRYFGLSDDVKKYNDESFSIKYFNIDSVEFIPYEGEYPESNSTFYLDSGYGKINLLTSNLFELNGNYYEIISGEEYWAYSYCQLDNKWLSKLNYKQNSHSKEKEQIMQNKELYLELNDTEWESAPITHDRTIVRAIVIDDEKNYYFVRAIRNDSFGNATIIETSGGGVEKGEDLNEAIKRELLEELGATVEIICKIGVVSDYYNLINRHNINNYYLCKAKSFGKTHMTNEEIEDFHLSTLKLSYDQALAEYEKCSCTRLGRLIANREVPILKRAKELLDS